MKWNVFWKGLQKVAYIIMFFFLMGVAGSLVFREIFPADFERRVRKCIEENID